MHESDRLVVVTIPPLNVPSTLYSSLHSVEVVKAFKEGQSDQKDRYEALHKQYQEAAAGAKVKRDALLVCFADWCCPVVDSQFDFVVGPASAAPADDILSGVCAPDQIAPFVCCLMIALSVSAVDGSECEKLGASYLVIGSRGLGGLKRLLMGSTANCACCGLRGGKGMPSCVNACVQTLCSTPSATSSLSSDKM